MGGCSEQDAAQHGMVVFDQRCETSVSHLSVHAHTHNSHTQLTLTLTHTFTLSNLSITPVSRL